MTIIGLGVDIIEIARLESAIQRHGEAFIHRCFLASEVSYCSLNRQPARCYAARFAAKEAVSKALGTGIGADLGWTDMEICRKSSGEPLVILHGTGRQTAQNLGIVEVRISLSHSENYAVATAIAIGG